MSQPQPQPQGAPAAQQPVQLLKADDIPKLQCLSNDMKQKYRPIVQNFWTIMQTKPSNGPEYIAARGKLQEWSTKLISQERNHRARMKAAQAQQNQGQGQSAQQSQPGQTQGQAQGQPATQQLAQQQQQQQPNSQQQPQQQQQSAMQPAPNAAQQQPRPAQSGQHQIAFDPEIIKHVQSFKFFLPVNGPQAGTAEGDAKIKEMRNSYLMALNKQQKATQRIKMLQSMEQSKQQAGQEIPAELPVQRQNMEKEYNTSKEWIDKFRKTMTQNRAEQEQRRNQQQGQAQPQQQQQQQAQPASQPVKEEPQVKVEGGQMPQAPPAQQFTNMGAPTTQPPQQATQGPTPSLPQQQQQQLPQQMRQPPAPHAPITQNQPQFAQPGPPQRPPINPHQANSMPQVHQQNSPHPQSATSNGAPTPLSHSAAVSAAQRSYSNQEAQRTNTPISGGGQGNFHNPGSREREQLNNPKMPIPRQLPPMATQPVAMGQARPTMSGPTNGAPGPMGQPVISKFPPFQLEGDSDRVLSKRKLDELVRQVTGGSEEALTPEVEEAVLQLADDFVDTVITNACKLSKLRESSQLDVRDIQMVLERSYNIRIPGYASDEVRTVRRLVPAPGWTQKMNAVQAAKVMGGKNDI